MLQNGVDEVAAQSCNPAALPDRLTGGVAEASTAFGYDPVGRLASLAHDLGGATGDVAWTYGHNPASQVRTVTRDNDAYAWTGHYGVTRGYAANGLNQYTAAGPASFDYDANGNLTSDGTNAYLYDVENRLVGAPAGIVISYDPLGRLWQIAGAAWGTRQFLYDGDALVAIYNVGDVVKHRYVHGPGADVPLIWYEEGGSSTVRRYLFADHQGSIVQIAWSGGSPWAINAYDEYGIPQSTNVGRFQYTGQVWLPEIGMYHYKARIYSPTLGRFLQTDPVGYEDQYNLYAYVGNDPVNLTDPTGEQQERLEANTCSRTGGGACSGSYRQGMRARRGSANVAEGRCRMCEAGLTARIVSLTTLGDYTPEQVQRDIDAFLEDPLQNFADVAAGVPGGRGAAPATRALSSVAGEQQRLPIDSGEIAFRSERHRASFGLI